MNNFLTIRSQVLLHDYLDHTKAQPHQSDDSLLINYTLVAERSPSPRSRKASHSHSGPSRISSRPFCTGSDPNTCLLMVWYASNDSITVLTKATHPLTSYNDPQCLAKRIFSSARGHIDSIANKKTRYHKHSEMADPMNGHIAADILTVVHISTACDRQVAAWRPDKTVNRRPAINIA